MKTKILKCVALVLAMACLFCFPVSVSATSQGTNGDELEIMQPETLEIQLGETWAGVEFELKTDAGMYPSTIPVGADGVLRMEIGGSQSYILTCMNSTIEAPAPGETVPESTDAAETQTPAENNETDPSAPTKESGEATATEPFDTNTIAGIPVKNLAMFGGGLLLAIGALVGMSIWGKKKERPEIDEDDEF